MLRIMIALIAGSVWLANGQPYGEAEPPVTSKAAAASKETNMVFHAQGSFDVKLTPQAPDDAEDALIARTVIDKKFHGELEGTSKAQMLSARTGMRDSGAYVAIERVSGSLNGRSGTFLFQHSGTMNRGVQQLTIDVVPDSGTEQLVGLSGRLEIKIVDGRHDYDFEYTLTQQR
jgi:hypothetical protein